MKKTLNVNLNGRVFTIDEDAYRLLDNYLSNLRIYFHKAEGSTEIIADFEARIEELFSEKNRLGYQVITLEHVEEVIARVGRPADFEADEEEKEEKKQTSETEPVKGKKKFFRNVENKLLGGVCSGIATYFDWNTALVRIVTIVMLFVFSSIHTATLHIPLFTLQHSLSGWLVIAYVILWIVIPAARTVEQKLHMHGKPVTVENIGKTVAAESAPVASKEPKGCMAGFADLFVSFLKVCLAGLGCLVGLPILFALIVVIIVLFAVFLGVGGGLMGVSGGLAGLMPSFIAVNHPVLATITVLLLIGIPVIAILYSIVAAITKLKPLPQTVKWAFLLIWILSLILFIFSGFRIDRSVWFSESNWKNGSNVSLVTGNGNSSKKSFAFTEEVTSLVIDNYLVASILIEQVREEGSSIEIIGDQNIVDLINYKLNNGKLSLSALAPYRKNTNLTITLRTGGLTAINSGVFIGDVMIKQAFTGDEMTVTMKGVGNFYADSLYVNTLKVRTEGVGSVRIAGNASRVGLETAGTGKIDANSFRADTVYARVKGVGSIQCDPVNFLDGQVRGVGSIIYNEEPQYKNTGTMGVGKVKRR